MAYNTLGTETVIYLSVQLPEPSRVTSQRGQLGTLRAYTLLIGPYIPR